MHPIEIIAAVGAIWILIKIALVLFAKKSMQSFGKSVIGLTESFRWLYLALAVFLGYFIVKSVGIVVLFASGIVMALLFDFVLLRYKKSMKTMMSEAFENIDVVGYLVFAALAVWVLKVLFF
jgi:hypothetical protein